jgi:hypothetical protein
MNLLTMTLCSLHASSAVASSAYFDTAGIIRWIDYVLVDLGVRAVPFEPQTRTTYASAS